MNEIAERKQTGLVERFAGRYHVDSGKLMHTLKQTAFRQRQGEVSNEAMMSLLVVADQYKLNPFTREIYAFPDKNNGIVPVVGVDGWSRIINSHPQFDGMEYNYSENMVTPDGAKSTCHEWVECVMHRKDRGKPVVVYRPPFKKTGNNGTYNIDGPWQTHPKRFLRHKATIQCARLAFGFVGIYDPDEAERIQESYVEGEVVREEKQIEQMPDEVFSNNIGEYRDLILSGTPADDVAGMISTRYTLTDHQMSTLYDIEDNQQEQENAAIES